MSRTNLPRKSRFSDPRPERVRPKCGKPFFDQLHASCICELEPNHTGCCKEVEIEPYDASPKGRAEYYGKYLRWINQIAFELVHGGSNGPDA